MSQHKLIHCLPFDQARLRQLLHQHKHFFAAGYDGMSQASVAAQLIRFKELGDWNTHHHYKHVIV